jgi:uncharacterized protein (DUF983 family)
VYCPTCGTQLVETLSYCNRCGANLSTLKERSPIKSRGNDFVVSAIVGNTIVVLGMILAALVMMKGAVIGETLGIAFVFLCLLELLVIDGSLLRELRRLNSGDKARGMNVPPTILKEELGASRARSLPQPLEPVPSITEHTTHTLEPLYTERERS